MAFFDDIGKKITDVSQTTIQKGKEIADTAKYNSAISDEEKKILSLYEQIGRLYMQIHGREPENAFVECVDEVKASLAKIEDYKEKILTLKGVTKCCTKCGAEVTPDAVFCKECGAKIEYHKPMPAQPEVIYCANCNAVLSEGTAFCTSCGKPVDVPQNN